MLYNDNKSKGLITLARLTGPARSKGLESARYHVNVLSFECDVSRIRNNGKMNENNMKSTQANRGGVII